MQREARDDPDIRTIGSGQHHPTGAMEAAHEREDVVPSAPHPTLRRSRGAVSGGAALGPSADELLADRRRQERE